jgi:hypothetical protein
MKTIPFDVRWIPRAISHTRLTACDRCTLEILIGQKVETVQVHFALEDEGLNARKNYHS